MCTPAALAAVSMIQAGLGIQSQNKAASQAVKYGNAATASTILSTRQQYQQLSEMQQEAGQEAAQKKTLRIRQGLRDRAFITAAMAEGVGSARSIAAASIAAGEDIGAIEATRKSTVSQIQRQKIGLQAETQSRLNEIESQVKAVAPVSPLSAMLQLGIAGFTGYNQGATIQAQFGNRKIPTVPKDTGVSTAVSMVSSPIRTMQGAY